MNKRETLEQALAEYTIERLGKKEFYALERKWLEIFCKEQKKKFGVYIVNGFRWHTFSGGAYRCLENSDAVDAYNREVALEYYVFPESGDGDFVLRLKEKPPTSMLEEYRDFYVFPKNMAWTMAFTHEFGWLGPYFAENIEYESLNKKNKSAYSAKSQDWT